MVVNQRGRKRNADVAYYHLRRTAVTTCLLAVPNHNLLWRIKLSEGTRPHDHEAAAAGHSRRAEVSRSRLSPHNAPARDGIAFLFARRVDAMSAFERALECPGLLSGITLRGPERPVPSPLRQFGDGVRAMSAGQLANLLDGFRPAAGVAALAFLKRASAHLLLPRCYPAVLSPVQVRASHVESAPPHGGIRLFCRPARDRAVARRHASPSRREQ
jgi:hypothetical protein